MLCLRATDERGKGCKAYWPNCWVDREAGKIISFFHMFSFYTIIKINIDCWGSIDCRGHCRWQLHDLHRYLPCTEPLICMRMWFHPPHVLLTVHLPYRSIYPNSVYQWSAERHEMRDWKSSYFQFIFCVCAVCCGYSRVYCPSCVDRGTGYRDLL